MNENIRNKWLMYHEVHILGHRDGWKPSQIANHLGIDARTVRKLLAMTEQNYEDSLIQQSTRRKKLQDYEGFVKGRIECCLDASAAQVLDWLKEAHPDFQSATERTVYNFVVHVRQKYGLAKVFKPSREFGLVEPMEYGKQAQVDFGETNMTDVDGQSKKVYFMALVLSRSRYKFVTFSDTPLDTDWVIMALEQAFSFIGGYPQEVVFDQDKKLLFRENKGNLVFTEKFRKYTADKPFSLWFCRKSDPQSKGKIENVVKFVKYNFLRGRTFYDMYTLNAQAIEWLDRTANTKVHATTRLIPAEEWEIEKKRLTPQNFLPFMADIKASYHVRKDNCITYKGSLYSVPIGTYKGEGTLVLVATEENQIIIYGQNSLEIARHPISFLKGQQVRNNNHFRHTDHKIDELIRQISSLFPQQDKVAEFLSVVKSQKPRYARDQIMEISKVCKSYPQEQTLMAMEYCLENNILNATDFGPVVRSLAETSITVNATQTTQNRPIDKHHLYPQKSNINDYNHFF